MSTLKVQLDNHGWPKDVADAAALTGFQREPSHAKCADCRTKQATQERKQALGMHWPRDPFDCAMSVAMAGYANAKMFDALKSNDIGHGWVRAAITAKIEPYNNAWSFAINVGEIVKKRYLQYETEYLPVPTTGSVTHDGKLSIASRLDEILARRWILVAMAQQLHKQPIVSWHN